MPSIDFHTHAFTPKLARRVIPELQNISGLTACHNGTVAALLRAMDAADIERAVVLSIATKVEQFETILSWSVNIASERLFPFASVHPDDPRAVEHVEQIWEAGLKGIKLHPYYQNCALDDTRLNPFYRKIEELGLILLIHTGYDIGFDRIPLADPPKIAAVLAQFPKLSLVCSHLGAWKDWDLVETHLLGKAVYMDISFSLQFMSREQSRRIILSHPKEYLLYGSDSPWQDQRETQRLLAALDVGDELTQAILYDNAFRLLGL